MKGFELIHGLLAGLGSLECLGIFARAVSLRGLERLPRISLADSCVCSVGGNLTS